MSISDKHIVITGGTSGLGLEMLRILRRNNQISLLSRPSERLNILRSQYPEIDVYEVDLAEMGSVEAAADRLVKSETPVDILINNAAVQYTPRFTDPDFRYESIQREINVNFTSICTLIYLLLPRLLNERRAMIININSGLGLVPKTSSAIYCATKGAVNIFSQSLRHQLANTNIEVRQVFLPLVDTPMTEGRGSGKLPADKTAQYIVSKLHSHAPDINVGKVKLLRLIMRVSPRLAAKIMKAG